MNINNSRTSSFIRSSFISLFLQTKEFIHYPININCKAGCQWPLQLLYYCSRLLVQINSVSPEDSTRRWLSYASLIQTKWSCLDCTTPNLVFPPAPAYAQNVGLSCTLQTQNNREALCNCTEGNGKALDSKKEKRKIFLNKINYADGKLINYFINKRRT